MKYHDFEASRNRMQRQHTLIGRIVWTLIIVTFLLSFLLFVVQGVLAYNVVMHPELIGEWFNKLMNSFIGSTK